MSEGNERNLQSIAPEATEDIEREAEKVKIPEAEPAQPAEAPKGESEKAVKEAPTKKKSKKKRKRDRHNTIMILAAVLVAALVAFGVLVGYVMGRVRGARELRQAQEQVDQLSAGLESLENAPAYDSFTEELTGQNQQALDALSGADAASNDGADALMGEEGFFNDDPIQNSAAEPVVVAEYGDGQTLMSDEVLEEYNEQMASYILAGFSEEEEAGVLMDDVLESMVSERVQADHAREMGLYDLTDEDRAEIEAQATAQYDEYLRYYRENMVDTGDMTEEEAAGAAKAYLLNNEGISYDYLVEELERNWWQRKLYDALTDSVTVDDATVRAAYDERLAEQKAEYAEYPEDFEFAQRNGEIMLYNLPGYRAVKVLLLGFDSEEDAMTVYSLAEGTEGEATDADRQAKLDACYAGPEERARQALDALRGGADMDEMILSVGQDEGMKDERQRAVGYYVSADSMQPEAFIEAAMGLQNVGDYSEPVRTEDGMCILQYLGDVTEGEVPFEDVRDALAKETLDVARSDAYAEQVQAWLEEAKPSYYPERMQ